MGKSDDTGDGLANERRALIRRYRDIRVSVETMPPQVNRDELLFLMTADIGQWNRDYPAYRIEKNDVNEKAAA